MTDASIGPTAAELFRKWQVFFDGDPASATSLVDSAAPDVAGPLRRLIDDYFSSRSTYADRSGGAPPEEEPPPDIPGYTILERLGRGGMGEVFRVRDALDREYALKVARARQLSVAGRERFLSEARAMARLDHPHIVKVGDYKENDGRPYFTMDLYPANLSDRVGDYADTRAAVRLMAQVADGVGHLHARGFIHRDLKPSNILLTADGRPVVSDFGLIKGPTDSDVHAADSGAHGSAETNETGAGRSRTVAGMILGTRRYMAPDQAAGLNHLAGPAWDVWALGVMLHELLTGQPPRSSVAPDRLLNPIEPDNPPPTRIKPDLDPRLGRIVEKCLARDPADRYPNGSAVAANLKAWLHRNRRIWTRVIAVSALVLLLAGTITAAMTLPRKRTPSREEILTDIQQQLRDGKTVELIGPTGMPRWYEVVASGGSQPFVSDIDGTMRVSTEEMTLIDLATPDLDRYRFEVEVRHLGGSRNGDVGAFAGRHRLPSTTGEPVDCFASIWLKEAADVGAGLDPARQWTVGVRHHKEVPGIGGVGPGQRELSSGKLPPNGEHNGWHTLTVEVRPDRMICYFDGALAGTVELPLARSDERFFANSAMLVDGVHTGFSPAGGYGVAIHQGSAAIRNARVIPVDQ
jgi:serine/threonine protein kinase